MAMAVCSPYSSSNAVHIKSFTNTCFSFSKRCNIRTHVSNVSAMEEATRVELPCLPFNMAEVLVPSSTKVLHLYEARFLALLEEALRKCNNLFVHVVVQQTGRESNEYSFRYGCLSHIQHVKRLEIGALVTIRGIGRVKLISLSQLEPFLKGLVVPLKDATSDNEDGIFSLVESLKGTLADVERLQIKLKASKEEPLQTPLKGALEWAEKTKFNEKLDYFIPSTEERISFAALQPVTGANGKELRGLLQQRLNAMDLTDTQERLLSSIKYAQESRSIIAAKVAIQSLQL